MDVARCWVQAVGALTAPLPESMLSSLLAMIEVSGNLPVQLLVLDGQRVEGRREASNMEGFRTNPLRRVKVSNHSQFDYM